MKPRRPGRSFSENPFFRGVPPSRAAPAPVPCSFPHCIHAAVQFLVETHCARLYASAFTTKSGIQRGCRVDTLSAREDVHFAVAFGGDWRLYDFYNVLNGMTI
ncbi:hypothetical protein Ppro_1178 [Pelobacter propionicus DSM 2379]|uniref:Uncharacterized protein n=1 Tax=Pelobacter propionicus (strain DSM 2379 / NBRC 103807 / OttBd1) TaxID=338966 RepID=A1AN80_PELPD|nr:hypothetical protein Ppro_1178 [Pelobacter propionicus DSM 2379]